MLPFSYYKKRYINTLFSHFFLILGCIISKNYYTLLIYVRHTCWGISKRVFEKLRGAVTNFMYFTFFLKERFFIYIIDLLLIKYYLHANAFNRI